MINAMPTKEFFINMMTRDIGLKEAITELVDNSIDAARRFKKDTFDGYEIKLEINQDEFSIEDNCGGMTPEVAQDFAFRFGRPANYKDLIGKSDITIGRFGIGMKRALFRLGRNISIKSTTKTSFFEVNISVDEWVKNENNWNFNFTNLQNNQVYEAVGTIIKVTNLYPEVKDKLNLNNFISELKKHIEVYDSKTIEKEMSISINNTKLGYYFNGLYLDENFKPAYKEMEIHDVSIKIFAGIGDTGFPKNAGWYLYCNDRLIVFADQTNLTGWGEDGIPLFHTAFARFRGFVYFESSKADELPWNTTKTGVDTESYVYIVAKTSMKKLMQLVLESIRKLTTLKEERESEETTQERPDEVGEELLKDSKNVDIKDIITSELSDTVVVSSALQKKLNNYVTISYLKEREKVEKVKKTVNLSSFAEVGRFTFDYYCDMEEID